MTLPASKIVLVAAATFAGVGGAVPYVRTAGRTGTLAEPTVDNLAGFSCSIDGEHIATALYGNSWADALPSDAGFTVGFLDEAGAWLPDPGPTLFPLQPIPSMQLGVLGRFQAPARATRCLLRPTLPAPQPVYVSGCHVEGNRAQVQYWSLISASVDGPLATAYFDAGGLRLASEAFDVVQGPILAGAQVILAERPVPPGTRYCLLRDDFWRALHYPAP